MRTSTISAALLTATTVWALPTELTKRFSGVDCGTSNQNLSSCTDVLGICSGVASVFRPQHLQSVIIANGGSSLISNNFDKTDATGFDVERLCEIMGKTCCTPGTVAVHKVTLTMGPNSLQIVNNSDVNF